MNNLIIPIKKKYFQNIVENNNDFINTSDNLEKLKLLIIRDLLRLNWIFKFQNNHITITPPEIYEKRVIQELMYSKRFNMILKNKEWIDKHYKYAISNLANGIDVYHSEIQPIIEVCNTPKQHVLFRFFRYYWSSPYSNYVGRRIRLLIRDRAIKNKPVIGIAALGSSIIHIPDRDTWIGWETKQRTENIVKTMDAFVIGALPPYNYILGGKLISYILASNEIRKIYYNRYCSQKTIIKKRIESDLVCIFTTGLYGKSSQYNKIKYKNRLLYIPVGYTKGYGSIHLSEETIREMITFLRKNHIIISNRFGSGPSWRMRVIRHIGKLLDFNTDTLLQHSFKRSIYAIPLAENFKEILLGKREKPIYYNWPLNDLVDYWKDRWFLKRVQNRDVIEKVITFKESDFKIY